MSMKTLSLGLMAAVMLAAPGTAEGATAPEAPLGFTGKLTPVHKKDCEGAIMIDSYTGQVATPADERPDWADGLALANLAERHKFYTDRLGPSYSDDHKAPDLFAYEDLEWLAVAMEDGLNDDGTERKAGDEMIVAADAEHRQDVMATILGVDREEGDMGAVLAEAEIASDNERTGVEMEDFRQAQSEGMAAATGTDSK